MFSANYNFEYYIKSGNSCLLNEKYKEAIKFYSQAIALRPNEAWGYYLRGEAYWDKGNADEALEDFNTALTLNPDYISCLLARGYLHYDFGNKEQAKSDFVAAYALIFQGKQKSKNDHELPLDISKEIIYEAILKNPDRESRIQLYNFCLQENHYLGSIMWKERGFLGLKCDLNSGTLKKIRQQIAAEYTAKGDEIHSLESYEQAIDHYPNYGPAYLSMGKYYQRQQEFEMALGSYQKAVYCFTLDLKEAKDPASQGNALLQRGLAYFYQGLYEQANLDFSEAEKLGITIQDDVKADLKINNTLLEDYLYCAKGFYLTNNITKAAEYYKKALMLCPTHVEAQYQLERIEQNKFFSPAKSRFISELPNYESSKEKAEKKTAHFVFPLAHQNILYFFKSIEQNHMADLEAVANYFYRMILPGKVAPNKAYRDKEGHPVGIKSKGIPKFKTLKDKLNDFIKEAGDVEQGRSNYLKWFKDYLSDPIHYRWFIEILAAAFYRCEDDLHAGNIAINEETGQLYIFDTDCSIWPVMVKFKGNRAGVDSFNYRDPESAFHLYEEDVRNFPYLISAMPHYFPGRHPDYIANTITKPIVEQHTTNLYFDDFINYVQQLGKHQRHETLTICFRIWLGTMLYGSDPNLYRGIATLYLDKDATHDGKNIIETIAQFESKRNQEFWNVLTAMPEFQEFLQQEANNGHPALRESLVNCLQRNQKLEKAAEKYPERAEEFDAARFPLGGIIDNYNTLFKLTNAANLKKGQSSITMPDTPIVDTADYLCTMIGPLKTEVVQKNENYNNWINVGKNQ